MRFTTTLLLLLQAATALRRVVIVGGGGYEGPLDPTDFQARRIPLTQIRGHLTTLISLGLEAVARTAPDVSFVHNFPGAVKTALFSRMEGVRGVVMRTYFRWEAFPTCKVRLSTPCHAKRTPLEYVSTVLLDRGKY
jgi:hypothetical protein